MMRFGPTSGEGERKGITCRTGTMGSAESITWHILYPPTTVAALGQYWDVSLSLWPLDPSLLCIAKENFVAIMMPKVYVPTLQLIHISQHY